MNFFAVFMAVFAVIGGLDLIFGCRFKLGQQFEKGFLLFGTTALAVIGMVVLAPVLGKVLSPLFGSVYSATGIDPSVFPAMIFANDMGGASLCKEITETPDIGLWSGLVVTSMLGCTVSYTIPLSLGLVKPSKHKSLLLGLLCGVITIPLGCFISGLMVGLSFGALMLNSIPMILFSVIIVLGLVFAPQVCVKVFEVFGVIIKGIIIFGLVLGIFSSLTGLTIIKGLADIKEGGLICLNASIVMSGAFVFLELLTRLFKKPLEKMGKTVGINHTAAFGFFSTLAASVSTFELMNVMDDKGACLNSAFAVSATSALAGHLAFTMAFNSDYILPVIVGKLISAVTAVAVASVVYNKTLKSAPTMV